MSNPPTPAARPTTFHLVTTRPRARRFQLGGRAWATLLLLIAAAGLVGASNLAVNQKSDTASLYAERFSVGENFELADSAIWAAKENRVAKGVLGTPVEFAATPHEAYPDILGDQWVYSVTLKEAEGKSMGAGTYTADLYVDERQVGRVFLEQRLAEDAVESVRLSFPAGSLLSTSALYYLVVKPYVETLPIDAYKLQSTPTGGDTWTGMDRLSGVNPPIATATGKMVKLTAVNGDGVMHNIAIKQGSIVQNPPGVSGTIQAVGDQVTIAWVPPAPGEYTYYCAIHPNSMRGTLTVA